MTYRFGPKGTDPKALANAYRQLFIRDQAEHQCALVDARRRRLCAWALSVWIVCCVVALACAAPAEMVVIGPTPTGPTVTLCQGGTVAQPTQSAAFIAILDQPVWYTIDSPTRTPSASFGGLAGPGVTFVVDHATDFRAVRQGAVDARLYVMCIP
jgi:hypothetical protein